MKVCYIGSGYEGCYYVRCLLPLRANGWYGEKTSLRGPKEPWERVTHWMMASDLIVFHRPEDAGKLELAKLLRQLGKKIVCDNDDAYDPEAAGRPQKSKEEYEAVIHEFVKAADLVTVSTSFLAAEYGKINPNVVVLPNFVDPDDWPEPLENESHRVRIGITGSLTITKDCEGIKDTLRRLSADSRVQLVVFGLPPQTKECKPYRELYAENVKFWESLNCESQPFVPMADYMDTLNGLRLDLLLIPRADTYFNRCKSNLKFLEASILGIPVIAQGLTDGASPYQNPADAQHMVVVNGDRWLPEIETLIEDRALRKSIGTAARDYIFHTYNIHTNAHLWEQAYEGLFNT